MTKKIHQRHKYDVSLNIVPCDPLEIGDEPQPLLYQT